MHLQPAILLIFAVAAVGILHTMVPDHWVPIALIARQQGWTRARTASAALKAGIGHVVSTLLIGAVVWLVGMTAATHFGQIASMLSSAALIVFGGWIALSSLHELSPGHQHPHAHEHSHVHEHQHDTSQRNALLLILGSSPMVEGLPAFFAAGKFGPGLIAIMAVVFAASTIATYVTLCIHSADRLQRISFGPWERYGEVLSGAFIALVGLIFLIWPIL